MCAKPAVAGILEQTIHRMRFKNYKSAIHNFSHSFQSVDFTQSGKLAFNVLIHLNNLKLIPSAIFDFVNKTIEPEEAISIESRQLLDDYLEWLPIHFANHNCDLDKLEKLTLVVSADFDNAFYPQGMDNAKQICTKSTTYWKAENRNEDTIEISLNEIIEDLYIKSGIPEM
ncbi:MAG: hypothetical protein KBG80_04035 [Breznakibacter sp.]|nr:hypothetical protein [Breznakibacter sp.]